MTREELAALPVGTIVKLEGDSDLGEIIWAGTEVRIMWPESNCTSVIDTRSKKWQTFIRWLEVENA